MKRTICLMTAIILLISFMNPCNQQTVQAGEEQSTRLLINSAKYALGLFLLAKLGETLTRQRTNHTIEIKDQDIDPEAQNFLSDTVIVIDPGHGGYDPGATGPSGLLEKDINLEVALKLYNLLKTNTEATVYLTRSSDIYISLSERTTYAREKNADIFISIHHNGEKSGRQRGLETYAHYNSSRQSWALAWDIHDCLSKQLGLPDKGLMAANFQVLR
ncbi:MAG: N-acetylmuramoyl-L-alanine amidase family protein, partial [Halanaerobiaceae bacterium]